MLIRCCAECAKKIEQRYIVQAEGSTETGGCPFCYGVKTLGRYEITPRKKRYNRRTGGGERHRAGRDRG